MDQFIRPMETRDIPQASEIEREAFPPPWPATNFKRDLSSSSLAKYIVVCRRAQLDEAVPETGEEERQRSPRLLSTSLTSLIRLMTGPKALSPGDDYVVGFAGMWFMVDEAHLSNIAVRNSCRRQGVGEHLLIGVIEQAVLEEAQFVTLEVRASNEEAKMLYRKYGFVEVGVRRNYYSDNKEDAVLMTAHAIGSRAYLEFFERLKRAHARRLSRTE